MAQSNLGRLFRDKVSARIDQYANDLVSGNAQDYHSYRQIVGIVSGMNESIQIMDDIERERD